MDFLQKWERKWGKRALPHLTRYIIMTYIAGYVLMLIGNMNGSYDAVRSLLTLSPSLILKGQVWRVFSWLLIPPNSLTSSAYDLFTIIMLFVYFQLGSMLERIWGDFLYNVYIFTGLIMTIIGAFLLFAGTGVDYGALFSTYYVSLSIFLGFAMTFPEQRMLFMFFIPLKIKYLAFVDIIYLAWSVIQAAKVGLWLPVLVMVLCSLAGSILFFFGMRKGHLKNKVQRDFQKRMSQAQKARQQGWTTMGPGWGGQQNSGQGSAQGQQNRPGAGWDTNSRNTAAGQGARPDRTAYGPGNARASIHRCAVCGRTELDAPDLEFRFCSRCNGNYEYCSDHLHSHMHVQ